MGVRTMDEPIAFLDGGHPFTALEVEDCLHDAHYTTIEPRAAQMSRTFSAQMSARGGLNMLN